MKSIFRQQIKEIKGTEIQNKKRTVQKLFGDAVGKISLSHTSISINHKIIEFFSEAVYEVPGLVISLMGGVQSGYAALGICELRGVILKRKMLKIFLFQDFPDIGLGIEKIHCRFAEAGAFFSLYIASVLTDGTVIVKLQIISRKSVLHKKRLSFPGQGAYSSLQVEVLSLSRTQDKTGFLKTKSGNLPADLS